MQRRTFWVWRAAHPLDHRYAARYHESGQRIPLHVRFFSYTAGRRDAGQVSLLEDIPVSNGEATPLPTTRWLTRNRNSCLEAMTWEYLDGESRTARQAHSLDRIHRTILRLERELDDAQFELERATTAPKPTLETDPRSIAEQNVDDFIVVARRMKTWTARVAASESKVRSLTDQLRDAREEAFELNALVQKAFRLTVTRAIGVHAWYERRANIYLRALVRRHENGPALQLVLADRDTVPTPAWLAAPCPWVPTAYQHESLDEFAFEREY